MEIFQFTLVKGHQIASGVANDPRFPIGTIAAQKPYFKALGLNLDGFHQATLNAKFTCSTIIINHYDYSFEKVKWHDKMMAEDFKFVQCQIIVHQQCYPAFIYQPQLASKTEHFHDSNQLEIIAPYIRDLTYGEKLALEIPINTLTLIP